MLSRIFSLALVMILTIPAAAQEPEVLEKAIALVNKKGFEVKMPRPRLGEYFKIPDSNELAGKEAFIPPRWLMAVFPAESPKSLVLVRCFSGDINDYEYGVDSDKGNAWLINQSGKLEQTCHWEKGELPEPIQEAHDLASFQLFLKAMKEWARRSGMTIIPRE